MPNAPRVNKLMLWCLLILDLIAFAFICWLYPIVWAPPAEEEGEASIAEKYETHDMILDYGQHITVYTLREHYDSQP